MQIKTLIVSCAMALIPAVQIFAQTVTPNPVGPDPINGAGKASFLKAVLPLDEPRHLCVDTRGFGNTPKTDESLWVHTCKDGMWNLDMRFAWSAAGTEIIMPQYELCVAALDAAVGKEITLEACGTEAAKWVYEKARLKPGQDTSLCLTIVKGRSEMTPLGSTFPPKYRWRELTLEPCSDDAFERQIWTMSQPVDVDKPILPPAGSLID